MTAYLLRRLGHALATIFVAVTLVFLAMRALPGNPLLARFGQHPDPKQMEWLEKQLGWDQKNYSYSMGELVAEIGACFWCAELGIDTGEFDQNCSYLKGWLESMANDPKFIFQASAQASKAVDYLLSFSRKPEQIEAPEAELVV